MKQVRVTLLSATLLFLLPALDCLAATEAASSAAGNSSPQVAMTPPSATACKIAPRQKSLEPKPDTSQRNAGPSISNVCAPVITIASPSALASSPDAQTPPQLKPSSSPGNPGAASAAPPKEVLEPPDTFKFKVKDLVEADLSSRSRVLVWALVAVFVAFGAIVVVGMKSVSKTTTKSGSAWLFALVATLVAAAVAYWVVRSLAPMGLNEATIEQLYATRTEWRAASSDGLASTQALALQLQSQLTTVKDELSEVRRQVSAQSIESLRRPTSDTYGPGWLQVVLIFVAGFALAYVYLRLRAPVTSAIPTQPIADRTSPTTSAEHFLPLADIYHLEDLLSMVAAITSDRTMGSFDKPADRSRALLAGSKPGSLADRNGTRR